MIGARTRPDFETKAFSDAKGCYWGKMRISVLSLLRAGNPRPCGTGAEMSLKLFYSFVVMRPERKFKAQLTVYTEQETPIVGHEDTDVMRNRSKTDG
jgi:hypothetical protein